MLPRLSVVFLAAIAAPAALSAQARQNATPNAAAPNAAAPAPNAAASASTRPSLRSWISDRRDFVVGDVLTILVDDYTITSAIKDDQATQRRTKDLGVTIEKPGGAVTGSVSGGLSANNNGNSQERGEARRENRFQSEMSVRIAALGPNNTIQIKGTRLIDVDKNKQNITLTGWVRAQDVSAANVVESSRVADAQLTYASPGSLSKAKQGIVSRIVSIVWP